VRACVRAPGVGWVCACAGCDYSLQLIAQHVNTTGSIRCIILQPNRVRACVCACGNLYFQLGKKQAPALLGHTRNARIGVFNK
jgi:hypothetical protein